MGSRLIVSDSPITSLHDRYDVLVAQDDEFDFGGKVIRMDYQAIGQCQRV